MRGAILPDVLEPGLRVVFCGTAAGKVSARVGAYYAGPANAFWPTLHDVGLTPRRLAPGEFRELPRYGIGLTDMCKVRSGSDAEIGTDAFDVERLVAVLDQNAPGVDRVHEQERGEGGAGTGGGRPPAGAAWSVERVRAAIAFRRGAGVLGRGLLAGAGRDRQDRIGTSRARFVTLGGGLF